MGDPPDGAAQREHGSARIGRKGEAPCDCGEAEVQIGCQVQTCRTRTLQTGHDIGTACGRWHQSQKLRRPRVPTGVERVAEAGDLALLGQDPFECAVDSRSGGVVEHRLDARPHPAVASSLKRTECSQDHVLQPRVRRGDAPGRERADIELVVGAQHQRG